MKNGGFKISTFKDASRDCHRENFKLLNPGLDGQRVSDRLVGLDVNFWDEGGGGKTGVWVGFGGGYR